MLNSEMNEKALFWLQIFILTDFITTARIRWRGDGRCGIDFPLPNGSPSECNPKSYRPCCSSVGYCGSTAAHCTCAYCTDYRRRHLKSYQRWRSDKRCGENFPLPDGSPTECQPDSEYPCCSNYGWCGASIMHCSCPECVNHRKHTQKITILWRRDLKCGWRYPLPNGEVTQCKPDSYTPCCAATGLCGATKDHCSCQGCVDYRKKSTRFQRWRSDKVCGENYPLPDGKPTECNPNSNYPCCSNYGFCGASNAHCLCSSCVDYRNKGARRKTKGIFSRCGRHNPCDPNSVNPCCSKNGICGATSAHCLCKGCVDSRNTLDDYPIWRSDQRCGRKFPLPNGKGTECNPNSDGPCCSSYGFCGGSRKHCLCRNCVDYRRYLRRYRKWRDDGHCGSNFPLPDKGPTQCDPDSDTPCCSSNGFCGKSRNHCSCKSCIDYRKFPPYSFRG